MVLSSLTSEEKQEILNTTLLYNAGGDIEDIESKPGELLLSNKAYQLLDFEDLTPLDGFTKEDFEENLENHPFLAIKEDEIDNRYDLLRDVSFANVVTENGIKRFIFRLHPSEKDPNNYNKQQIAKFKLSLFTDAVHEDSIMIADNFFPAMAMWIQESGCTSEKKLSRIPESPTKFIARGFWTAIFATVLFGKGLNETFAASVDNFRSGWNTEDYRYYGHSAVAGVMLGLTLYMLKSPSKTGFNKPKFNHSAVGIVTNDVSVATATPNITIPKFGPGPLIVSGTMYSKNSESDDITANNTSDESRTIKTADGRIVESNEHISGEAYVDKTRLINKKEITFKRLEILQSMGGERLIKQPDGSYRLAGMTFNVIKEGEYLKIKLGNQTIYFDKNGLPISYVKNAKIIKENGIFKGILINERFVEHTITDEGLILVRDKGSTFVYDANGNFIPSHEKAIIYKLNDKRNVVYEGYQAERVIVENETLMTLIKDKLHYFALNGRRGTIEQPLKICDEKGNPITLIIGNDSCEIQSSIDVLNKDVVLLAKRSNGKTHAYKENYQLLVEGNSKSNLLKLEDRTLVITGNEVIAVREANNLLFTTEVIGNRIRCRLFRKNGEKFPIDHDEKILLEYFHNSINKSLKRVSQKYSFIVYNEKLYPILFKKTSDNASRSLVFESTTGILTEVERIRTNSVRLKKVDIKNAKPGFLYDAGNNLIGYDLHGQKLKAISSIKIKVSLYIDEFLNNNEAQMIVHDGPIEHFLTINHTAKLSNKTIFHANFPKSKEATIKTFDIYSNDYNGYMHDGTVYKIGTDDLCKNIGFKTQDGIVRLRDRFEPNKRFETPIIDSGELVFNLEGEVVGYRSKLGSFHGAKSRTKIEPHMVDVSNPIYKNGSLLGYKMFREIKFDSHPTLFLDKPLETEAFHFFINKEGDIISIAKDTYCQ